VEQWLGCIIPGVFSRYLLLCGCSAAQQEHSHGDNSVKLLGAYIWEKLCSCCMLSWAGGGNVQQLFLAQIRQVILSTYTGQNGS
jgi:hypothetical protein